MYLLIYLVMPFMLVPVLQFYLLRTFTKNGWGVLQNRDTSVLVKLRPAWEDLRSYLIAKGRKRFEVYVCTMAERDYALEMWRLLDPEAHLISLKQLLDRVVCVRSG